MNLGNRFKSYRRKAGFSQKEAAERLGIKSYQLANYETNRSEPSIAILKRMSYLYKVSIDYLVGHSRFGPNPDELDAIEKENEEFQKKLKEVLEMLQERYGDK